MRLKSRTKNDDSFECFVFITQYENDEKPLKSQACVVLPSTQTRSIFKKAHSSSRDFSSKKMESLWDVLPPELQECILKKKTKLEQRD